MENFILLKHNEKALNAMFYKKEQVEGKTLITTCQLAQRGLNIGFHKKGINAKSISYAEYLELNKKVD